MLPLSNDVVKCQTLKKKKGDLKQFNGIKLLNLSKDVLDYMSFLVYTLMYMYMIHVYMHIINLVSVHTDK